MPELTFDFDLNDPGVQDFIEERSFDFWEDVSNTTKDKLRKKFELGTMNGLTTTELASSINTGVFSELIQKGGYGRVRRIARTETTMAFNTAANEAHKQSGVVTKKSWLTSGDEAVRSSHNKAEREGIIPNDKKFGNGLMFPGDSNGEVKELVNCRCSLIPEVDKKEVDRITNVCLGKAVGSDGCEAIFGEVREGDMFSWQNEIDDYLGEFDADDLKNRSFASDRADIFINKKMSHIKNGKRIRYGLSKEWSRSSSSPVSGIMKDAYQRLEITGKTHFHGRYLDNDRDLINKYFKGTLKDGFKDLTKRVGSTVTQAEVNELLVFENEYNKAILRKIYGKKKITLYRGVRKRFFQNRELEILKKGDSYKGKFNSMGSWTSEKKVAENFGEVVFKTEVAVDEVIASYNSNSAFIFNEKEFILGNNNIKEVIIENIIKSIIGNVEIKKFGKDELKLYKNHLKQLKGVDIIFDVEKSEVDWLKKKK